MLESLKHDSSVFLTLTYDDQHLPMNGELCDISTGEVIDPLPTLRKSDHRNFMDLYRTRYRRATGRELRFYCVGEYGDKTFRPHFHYAIFGYPSCTVRGARYQGRKFKPCLCPNCQFISSVWGRGHVFVGDLTLDSASYIAGYVTKKLTSDRSSFQADKLRFRTPEFSLMSRKPGIARFAVDDIVSLLTSYNISDHDQLPRSLQHGAKQLPLGRYLSDKISEEMGFAFTPEEKIASLEKSLRDVLLHKKNDLPVAYKNGPVWLALKMLNAGRVATIEDKIKFFTKEKTI